MQAQIRVPTLDVLNNFTNGSRFAGDGDSRRSERGVAGGKPSEDFTRDSHICRVAELDQPVGIFGVEIASIAVNVDAAFEITGVGLWVELSGIDVLAKPDHLKRTALGLH